MNVKQCSKCGSTNITGRGFDYKGRRRIQCKDCLKSSTIREEIEAESNLDQITAYQKELTRLQKTNENLQNWRDTILDIIKDNIYRLPKVYAPRKFELNKKYKEENAILEFSDVQLGSLVKPEETGGLCVYDKNTFRKRVDKLAQSIYEIVEIQRKGGIPVNNLKLHCLGDIVQGESVFPGQGFKIDTLLLEQVFQLGDEIIDRLLAPLAELFSNIEIFCIPGNHGKQGRFGDASRTSNWDYVVYKMWQYRLGQTKHVKFYVSASPFLIYEMYPDQIHCLIHGQQARGWMGYPYYGIDRMHRRLTSLTGIYINYLHHGHHHQPAILDTHIGKKIGNGSIEGGSDYSVNDLLTANTPQQFFCGINKSGITWEYWIRLAEYPKMQKDEHGIYTNLLFED